MAAFNKYQQFVLDLGKGVHQLHAAGHTLKVMLSNAAPNAGTHAVRADSTEIGAGNGYTSGGDDIQNDYTTIGTAVLTGVDTVVTAAGGTIGPFLYDILYNDTPTGPVDPLIGWWVYPGAAITLQIGETFTTDFSSSVLTIT